MLNERGKMITAEEATGIYSLGYKEGWNACLKKIREYTEFMKLNDIETTHTSSTTEDNPITALIIDGKMP